MTRKQIQKAAPEAHIYVDSLTRQYRWGYSCCGSKKHFKTFGGAVRAAVRKGYEVTTKEDPMPAFLADDKRTKIVTVLGTDKLTRIGVNTPLCCDPSSETYWSM